MYKYFQPNVKDVKNDCGDCVVRALCKAFTRSWSSVFSELADYAKEMQVMPNEKACYGEFLKNNGAVWVGLKVKKGEKRPTVASFAEKNKGTKVLRASHHLITVVDNNYYDSWDSGKKCVYGYWEVKA